MATETLERALSEVWVIDEHAYPYGVNAESQYRFLVQYAVLAPSGHNTQPWRLEITQRGIDVLADPTRALPVVDPDNRERVISCGAVVEYLCVSARYFGHRSHIDYENRSDDPDFLARFCFGDRREPSDQDAALFHAIPRRHTSRTTYADQEVSADLIYQLKQAADLVHVGLVPFAEPSDRQALAHLIADGDLIQAADTRFRRELAAWVHRNRSHSRDGLPGSAFGFGDFGSNFGSFVIRTFDWGDGQAAKDEQLASGSPLLAVLKTRVDSITDWLNTGRALARVLLTLTQHRLVASFLNQPIELAELRPAVREQLGGDCEPQIILRIGYGPAAQATPRRPASDVLIC